jgi:hypothetical protein
MMNQNHCSEVWPAIQAYAVGLLGAWLERAAADAWLQFHEADGAVVWPDEVCALLNRHIKAQAGEPICPATRIDQGALWPDFLCRLDAALPTDPCAARWHDLLCRLRLCPAEGQLLVWLVALNLDAALARVWRYAWANTMRDTLSWGFACLVLAGDPSCPPPCCGLDDNAPVFLHGLIALPTRNGLAPRESLSLGLPPDVLAWLSGSRCAHAEFTSFDLSPLPPPRLQRLGPRLRDLAKLPLPLRAAVIGPDDPSRAAIVAQVATACRVLGGVWTLNLASAVARNRAPNAISRAKRMAALLDAAVAITHAERLHPDALRAWADHIDDAFSSCACPLIWVTEDDPPDCAQVAPEATFRIGYPSASERLAVWQRALPPPALPDDARQGLAARYLLTEGQIAHIARHCLGQDPTLHTLPARLNAACRDLSQRGLGKLATPESGPASFSQLLVNDDTADSLREILHSIRQRKAMSALFEGTVSYGVEGVTCLFTGPPGTGKTLAARVLAAEIGLELYRVDLSQLVDRFIGETEKKLGSLFNAAEASDVILLFDEADSLFGKRTEVKTSTDRYANLEVNYLLQRIEHFGGVVILTTNLESSIDDAFARRIRFKVSFDAPDPTTRVKIWAQLWPHTLQRAPDVDLFALSRDYELSGGHIKEVIVRAASLALSESHGVVTRNQLARCVSLEYKKLGKLSAATQRPRS